jgi:glycerol-3-phosphate acyltransferase PlsY
MPMPISWEFAWPYILGALAVGYLLGSIPFGLVLTQTAGLGDVRKIGSGNIGATNVLRTGHKGLALATLILDGGKGAAALLIGYRLYGPDIAVTAGLGAFLGHIFPVWLGFRGGKGVATALGMLLAASWPIGAIACLTWLLVAFLFRYSSLAALVSIALSPVVAKLFGWWKLPGLGSPIIYHQLAEFALIIAVIVWIRHAGNIGRLLTGREAKIGRKKSETPEPSEKP